MRPIFAVDAVSQGRLWCIGDLEHNYRDEWVWACGRFKVKGVRGNARSEKTWKDCMKADMPMLGLKRAVTWFVTN